MDFEKSQTDAKVIEVIMFFNLVDNVTGIISTCSNTDCNTWRAHVFKDSPCCVGTIHFLNISFLRNVFNIYMRLEVNIP